MNEVFIVKYVTKKVLVKIWVKHLNGNKTIKTYQVLNLTKHQFLREIFK